MNASAANRQIQGWLSTCVLVVACGGAPPPASPTTPATPSPASPSTGVATPSASQATQGQSPETSRPETVTPEVSEADRAPPNPNLGRPLIATQFTAELEALGLDPRALPEIGTLSATKKLDVMELMARSLGVDCVDCHVSQQDYRSETRNKRIARRMWNEFVQGRVLNQGALFCDSCHQGSPRVLQRGDREAVKAYMRTQYTARLSHAETAGVGTPLACADCHGKPFEPKIIERTWGIARAPTPADAAEP